MINALELRNFKCFSHLRLPFGRLTLLTGFNAAGKSTVIQPLLLLAQGLRNGSDTEPYPLNGNLIRLGAIGDIMSSGSNERGPTILLTVNEDIAEWRFVAKAGDRNLDIQQASMPSVKSSAVLAAKSISYISAVRDGAREAFPFPDNANFPLMDVGPNGQYAPHCYELTVDDEVVPKRRHPDEPGTSVRKQLDKWLGTLFPGAQANVQAIPQVSLMSLQFRVSETGPWCLPANVGYGLTYAFPILVALLVAKEGQLVIIDSPEAHLHPSAQSQMGLLLAHFAEAGVQIIVETHSDHLLNGARLAVKNKILSKDNIQIHFFSGATTNSHGVTSPQVDENGGVSEWPNGFFDQADKDLASLGGWV